MRIAIVGPESSGKSSLGEALSKALDIQLAPEYSRMYISDLGREYEYSDLVQIALGQEELITKSCSESNGSVITDTEGLSIKVWSLIKYKRHDAKLDEIISNQRFDLYLLCRNDLDWEEDDLRESPTEEERNLIFETFHQELSRHKLPFEIVEGMQEDRMKCALDHVKRRLMI